MYKSTPKVGNSHVIDKLYICANGWWLMSMSQEDLLQHQENIIYNYYVHKILTSSRGTGAYISVAMAIRVRPSCSILITVILSSDLPSGEVDRRRLPQDKLAWNITVGSDAKIQLMYHLRQTVQM